MISPQHLHPLGLGGVEGQRAHLGELGLLAAGEGFPPQQDAKLHIDEGLDFLGFRIQRKPKRGTPKLTVYTYPSKKSLGNIVDKVRTITRQGTNCSLTELLDRLNPVLRGWTNYFRHGVSKATFNYLRAFVWRRVVDWLRRKHLRANWRWLRRRYLPGWWPTEGETKMFDPSAVTVSRYRYRGERIASPWSEPARAEKVA